LRLTAAAVLVALLALAGCSTSKSTTNEDTHGRTTIQTAPSCLRNEPGCACAAEGKRIACGKVVGTDSATGRVTCGTGGQVCAGGKWGECVIDGYAPGHDGVAVQSLGSAGACTDACDLYCKTVPDVSDGTINLTGDGGVSPAGGGSSGHQVTLGDAGITLVESHRSDDGGITPEDLAVLEAHMDGGVAEAGTGLIFHELLPGETAQDPVLLPPGEIPSTDIYFLLDDTSSMADESTNLTAALNDANNLQTQIRALFNGDSNKVQFGFGRFEEYGWRPSYGSNYVTALDTTSNRPFQHLVSITPDDSAVAAAAGWVHTDAFVDPVSGGDGINHTGGTVPEASVTALMMLATGGQDYPSGNIIGAWRSGSLDCTPGAGGLLSKYWVPPRKCWGGTVTPLSLFTTSPAGDVGADTPGAPAGAAANLPCAAVSNPPAGYNPGFPCWRPNKTPIVVIMTDAPAHNGPGGQYSYVATPGTTSASSQAYMLTGELAWGTVAAGNPSNSADPASVPVAVTTLALAGADGSSFDAPVNLGTMSTTGKIIYGLVPNRDSASSVGGGITQSLTDRELVGSVWPGTLTANRTYRNTLRDCSTNTSVKVCQPGGTQYNHSDAKSDYSTPATPPAAPGTSFPTMSTVAFSPDTFSSTTSAARAAQPAPVDIGAMTTPAPTCDVITVNSTNTAAGYSTASTVGPTQYSAFSTSGLVQILGPIALTQGQRLNVKLDFVTVNAGDIKVRARVNTGSEPTATNGTATSYISSTATTTNKNFFAAAAGTTDYYIALQPDATVAGNGKLNVTYTIANPTCAGSYLDLSTTTATAAPKCYKCNAGYSFTATCPATATPASNHGFRGCLDAPAASCASYGATAFSGTGPLGGVCPAGKCCTQAAQPACGAVSGKNMVKQTSTTCTYCTTGTTFDGTNRCYDACPAAKPNVHNNNCYASCPAGYDVRASDKYEVCIQACAAGWTHTDNVSTDPPVCTGPSGAYTCAAGWTLSGTTCTKTERSCTCTGAGTPATCVAGACADGYACTPNGAAPGLGTATCEPTAVLCDDAPCTLGATCTAQPGPIAAGALNASPAVPAAAVPATSLYCLDSCRTVASKGRGDGARFGEMIFKFTVPGTAGSQDPADRFYYHFALLRQKDASPSATSPTWTSDAKSFLYLKAASTDVYNDAASGTNADGDVLDCNRDANVFYLKGDTSDRGHAVRSEINAFLYPGDYYLVVDKYGDGVAPPALPGSYEFVLQMGAFSESEFIATPQSPMTKTFVGNPYTAPTFEQTVQALVDGNVKVVGVDSSGVTCAQAHDASVNVNIAQYETRDWLEALGRATGAVRGKDDTSPGTGKKGDPFINSIRADATDCTDPTNTDGLRAAIVQNISDLTKTLREDVTLRAVNTGQGVSAPVYVPSDIPGTGGTLTPESFIQKVEAFDTAAAAALGVTSDVDLDCGSTSPVVAAIATDPSVSYSSQLYQLCLPGTSVLFRVTFVMPASIPRTTDDQYFRFDVILRKGLGEIGRTPVVLKLPKLPIAGDFYRDYDMSSVCPASTHIVWDRLSWDTDDPLASATGAVGSRIDITAVMATSLAGLATGTGTAAEKSLLFADATGGCTSTAAVARASPTPNTEVSSAKIDCTFGSQKDNYLRVHFRLSPSPSGAYPDNAVYVPTLKSWNLYVSCPPTE
jgi:hypothetical protein